MSDLTIIQGVWIGVPGASVTAPTPTPTPAPPTKVTAPSGGGAGGAGGNIHTPWEPLTYGGPVCGPEVLEAFKNVCRKRNKNLEKDALEVKRNIRENDERVKKSELRALRKRLAILQNELESKEYLKDDLELAKSRIRMLQRQIDFLEQRLRKMELEALAEAERLKNIPEIEVVAPVMTVEEAPPESPPRYLRALKAFLPYGGASAVSVLATYYLVPETSDVLKFSGYVLAVILANLGIHAALAELLDDPEVTTLKLEVTS